MKHEYDVVIIDSGINSTHPYFQNLCKTIDEIQYCATEAGIIFEDSAEQDTIGHGTAVPYYNYLYLLGALPDAFLLVVNYDDELEFVQKTIHFCESIAYGKVDAIVLSPISSAGRWSVVGSDFRTLSTETLLDAKERLESAIRKPVFMFSEIEKIVDYIIDQFQ